MEIRECKILNKKDTSKRIYIYSFKKCKEKDLNSFQKLSKKKICINNTKKDNKDISD